MTFHRVDHLSGKSPSLKTITSIAIFSTALAAFVVAPLMRAEPPDDAPPPRPPHGALSSVAASRTAKPPAPAPAKPMALEATDGYVTVGFDQLAGFPFASPALQSADAPATAPKPEVMMQVPASVKKLDDQKVVISGFMLPTKIEKGLATEFLLLNSPLMCCFGVTPSTNAWVVVKMPQGVPPIQDVPTPFCGRLHVRAQWEDGWLASIYQLDGEDPAKPHS